jgi:HK97 family phage portal protein
VQQVIARATEERLWGADVDPWTLPVVVACRGLIADTIAQLPLVTLRDRRPLAVQPTITTRPDPLEPRWLTFHRIANNFTRWGHCWVQVLGTDAAGYPSSVRVLDAGEAAATWDSTGRVLDTVWVDGQALVPDVEIHWLPFTVERRGSLGTSPLAECWTAIEDLAALWSMAGSFWRAGYPSLVVKVKQRLQPGQATQIKSQLISSMAGRHEPGVIDMDGDIGAIGSSAVEAQLVESIGQANAEVARAMRMPPSLVNVASGDSLTYSTVEGEFRRWLATGLGAYLNRIEAAFDDMTPRGQRTRFDTTELLRADFTARVEAYAATLAAGWMTVDEVRDLEGLDPLDQPAAPPAPITLSDAVPGA